MNTINGSVYGANTCVRIAYNAFQMEEFGIQFTLGNTKVGILQVNCHILACRGRPEMVGSSNLIRCS